MASSSSSSPVIASSSEKFSEVVDTIAEKRGQILSRFSANWIGPMFAEHSGRLELVLIAETEERGALKVVVTKDDDVVKLSFLGKVEVITTTLVWNFPTTSLVYS